MDTCKINGGGVAQLRRRAYLLGECKVADGVHHAILELGELPDDRVHHLILGVSHQGGGVGCALGCKQVEKGRLGPRERKTRMGRLRRPIEDQRGAQGQGTYPSLRKPRLRGRPGVRRCWPPASRAASAASRPAPRLGRPGRGWWAPRRARGW